MDISKANTKILQEESTLGIYVWEMPDGRWIGDEDGNYLSITSKKGNTSSLMAAASGFDPLLTAEKNKILKAVKALA